MTACDPDAVGDGQSADEVLVEDVEDVDVEEVELVDVLVEVLVLVDVLVLLVLVEVLDDVDVEVLVLVEVEVDPVTVVVVAWMPVGKHPSQSETIVGAVGATYALAWQSGAIPASRW